MDRSTIGRDESGSSRTSRREFLGSVALGGGLAVLSGTAVSMRDAGAAQIEVDVPVPATPGPEPPAAVSLGPTVASKAAELEFDTEKIFTFVRDGVRYEPYAGSLRGANGTLWSLGGNSADKAMLFAGMLDEALVAYRFAVGRLTPDQVNALTTAAMATEDEVLLHSARCTIAATEPPSFGRLAAPSGDVLNVPLTPEEEAEAVANQDAAVQIVSDAQNLATTLNLAIEEALLQSGISIPASPTFALPNLEVERHVWIQVADGPTWVDYFPTGVSGTLPTPDQTFDVLPEEFHHTVDIKLIAEELIGGVLQRRELVRLFGNASALVNVPIAMLAQPPGEFDAMGLAINQLFSGDISLIPYLYAGDIAVLANIPIVFGSDEASVLGTLDEDAAEGGLGEGETLAVWLDIQQTSPGDEPVHVERALMDRIGAELRLRTLDFSDPATRAAILPVKLVDFYDGTQTVDQLAAVHLLTTDLARLDISYAISDVRSGEVYGAAGFNVPAMTTLRDILRLTSESPLGFQSVISRPHFTLTSLTLEDALNGSSGGAVELGLDLLHHVPRVVPVVGSSSDITGHPAILAGVLDQVSEHQLVAAMERQEPGMARGWITVAKIFELAIEQEIPIVTVASDQDFAKLELNAVSRALLERGIAEDFMAVTPVRPVLVGEEERSGWWFIHPQTGQTRDQLDTGKGGASVRIGSRVPGIRHPSGGIYLSQTKEYTDTTQVARSAAKPFRRTLCGRIVNAVLGAAITLAAGVALANGDVTGAIKQLSPAAKVVEQRRKLKDLADAARRNGGSGCG